MTVGLINDLRLIFLLTARISMKLLEMPIEYAVISISPNGDKKRIESGGISPISGIVVAIALLRFDHAQDSLRSHLPIASNFNFPNDALNAIAGLRF